MNTHSSDAGDAYDVVVIGSGPGGGSLAGRLAQTGKRILLLERGDYLKRERANWDSREVFAKGRYTAAETFYDRAGKPFHPGLHYYVGGNSKVYGAALFRLTPADFGQIRHHGGISPAWPISYAELEPYYVQAEHQFMVYGRHGEDPFAGASSHDYAHPPVKHEPRIQELSDGLEKLGLHPFHLPLGINLDQNPDGTATVGSACIRCDRVDGFPCLLGAKSDAETAAVNPALAAHLNLTLITRATIQRLITDESGRTVTAVQTTMEDGSSRTFAGDIVVLSAGSILSSVLLLQSANDRHPRGLGNSSDVVGRHYMRHNNVGLMAVSKEPNPTVFQKTLALNDFYGPSAEWEYPMGNIQMLGKSDDWQIKAEAPKPFGLGPTSAFGAVASHALDFWLAAEDLPLPESRVTLQADGSVRLALQPENNTEGVNRLRKTFDGVLNRLDARSTSFARSIYPHKDMDITATAHQAGTVRFGTDPTAAALDLDCKAYDLDNLYVVDGSFMPSIGAVNPTLTIIANALRVADRIAERIL